MLAAGRGSQMTDLTSKIPKALLPIGNMPMLWYPINTLKQAGFEEAIVVVLDSYCVKAQKLLLQTHDVKMKLDFVSIPDQDYMGTADTLRYIKDKIKRDMLIISCDLVIDISLHNIANIFRTYDATVTMLLCVIPDGMSDIPVPGPKSKKRSERDFIGLDPKGSRVLLMTSEGDLADDNKVVFRRSVMKKHPNINIRSNLTDCHLYLMKKWVIDYLVQNRRISSIKGELIPNLVKKQFSKRRKTEVPSMTTESVKSEEIKTDILSFIPDDNMTSTIQQMSTWIDHTGDMEDCYHGDKIRCYAHVVSGGLCARTNTVASYCEINRQIPQFLKTVNKEMPNINPTAILKGKPQVGSDCLVGERATIADKVSIKKSIIARHCNISEKVKITNCIILDHVHIAEGCSLQNCVISSNAHINEKCELKDCIVGDGQNIVANSKHMNEALVEAEDMIEI